LKLKSQICTVFRKSKILIRIHLILTLTGW